MLTARCRVRYRCATTALTAFQKVAVNTLGHATLPPPPSPISLHSSQLLLPAVYSRFSRDQRQYCCGTLNICFKVVFVYPNYLHLNARTRRSAIRTVTHFGLLVSNFPAYKGPYCIEATTGIHHYPSDILIPYCV